MSVGQWKGEGAVEGSVVGARVGGLHSRVYLAEGNWEVQ